MSRHHAGEHRQRGQGRGRANEAATARAPNNKKRCELGGHGRNQRNHEPTWTWKLAEPCCIHERHGKRRGRGLEGFGDDHQRLTPGSLESLCMPC